MYEVVLQTGRAFAELNVVCANYSSIKYVRRNFGKRPSIWNRQVFIQRNKIPMVGRIFSNGFETIIENRTHALNKEKCTYSSSSNQYNYPFALKFACSRFKCWPESLNFKRYISRTQIFISSFWIIFWLYLWMSGKSCHA